MNLLQLSWKNLTSKPLAMLLSLVLFALGVGLIALLFLLNTQLQDKFEKNLAGIDMVLGAKGSPLQTILCSMYHIDSPTGNISIKDAKPFLRKGHPLIEAAIPLSLGDSYKTYRIVGTEPEMLELYEAKIEEGKVWEQVFEVVIGAALADREGLKLGDNFFGSHGFINDSELEHDDVEPFEVVGILEPNGSVIDQLILTNTQTVWAVHDHEGEAATSSDSTAHAHHAHETLKPLLEYEDKDITSVLVKFKARNFQTLNMPRSINENTDLQAANPAYEINRLYAMIGDGADALRVLAFVIIFVSGLSIFISLYSSLKERKYELALMRVMGASRGKLFLLILMEGLLLAVLGFVIGIIISHVGMELIAGVMQDAYRYAFSGTVFLKEEIYLLFGALGIGLVASIIPALKAFQTDISDTLSEA
ncbi:MAG: FtsX-like permease family protein [Bacteroidota bacterium]